MATWHDGIKVHRPTSLEGWLSAYKNQNALYSKQTDALRAKIAATGNAAKRASYNKQIEEINQKYYTNKSEIASTQNKVYVQNGQYDKLLSGTNRDAYYAVSALFKSYGLGSLTGKIYDYVKNGYSGDTISLLLQDSKEYKARFAGNEARKKAGLPVLTPAEYLATEASYKQIMQQAGLPSGFYDQPSDFNNWIGKNVSPSEIQSRVDLATQATTLANPDYRKALNQMGVSDKDLAAYFLDQKKALPFLQKSAATAAVGAAALGQGLTFDKDYAAKLATEGVTADQARQGYSNVAQELGTMESLGAIYGQKWDQRTSEQAVFEGNAEATAKRQKLISQERGNFSGAAGAARGGLSQAGGAK